MNKHLGLLLSAVQCWLRSALRPHLAGGRGDA